MAIDATPLIGARTGVGAFTAGLLGALAERSDVEVVAFAVTWRGREALASAVPDGISIVRRPMAARPLRALWAHGSRPPIEWWTGPVDVVHGTNFVVPPTRRAASVVSVHDLTPVRFPQLADRSTLAYRALISAAIARGAFVHTDSAFVAGEVADTFRAPLDRVVTVHPGVPPVAGGDAADGRALVGGQRYVLALGTIEPRKDLPSLVAAFDLVAEQLPDVRLVVAGQDGWGVDAFAAAVAAAQHRDRIVRIGWVDDAARAGLLAGASVFAYPSVYEGFGFPPLEAMTVGVPVVATATGSLPEVLGDAADLVPVGDVDALATSLGRLLTDRSWADRRVIAGQAKAASYSWTACGDAMVELYRRAMAARL